MIYADAHCHLTDNKFANNIESLILECEKQSLGVFFQGGVEPTEWDRQLEYASKYKSIKPIFGLHPMWVASQTANDVESALSQLARYLTKGYGIGEVGLDLRPQYAASLELQLDALHNQVELAEFTKLPLVWHLVRAFDFIKHNPMIGDWFKNAGMVHAFNGSWTQAQFYIDHGLILSVGGAVTYPDNKKLHEVIQKIPIENLVLETDSPDQQNFNDQNDINYPYKIWEIAKVVGDLRKKSSEDIMQASTQNLQKLFKLEL